MSIQEALTDIRGRLSRASSGRNVEFVAVSKTFDADAVRCAYDLGLRDFGENKVQEMLEKKALLPADIRWHMIGRLQTNKVKDIIGKAALIHSLDRVELFEKINSEAQKQKLERVECLLQVNISGEASKAGFAADQAADFLSRIPEGVAVKITGLMTMAPLTENKNEIRNVFRATHALFEKMKRDHARFDWKHLSMGMSGDFEIAAEEGATMVRIGTALFGARNNK